MRSHTPCPTRRDRAMSGRKLLTGAAAMGTVPSFMFNEVALIGVWPTYRTAEPKPWDR